MLGLLDLAAEEYMQSIVRNFDPISGHGEGPDNIKMGSRWRMILRDRLMSQRRTSYLYNPRNHLHFGQDLSEVEYATHCV